MNLVNVRKGFKFVLAMVLAFGVCAFLMQVSAQADSESSVDSLLEASAQSDVILDNVYIGEVSVGGMTAEEATEAVEDYVTELSEGTTVLVGQIGELEVDNSDFGLTWENQDVVEEALAVGRGGNAVSRYKALKDLEHDGVTLNIGLSVDEDTTSAIFDENEDDLEQTPVENTLTRKNGEFVIVEGNSGYEIDAEASIAAIEEFFNNGWDQEDNEINLVSVEVEPSVSVAELEKVQDLLGSYSTDYSSSSSARATNVENGASKINGTVLMPGEQFSVYEAVSPFTEENGYELAGTYENGTVVESFGGGICQVSTTLYNAILYAELQVDERYNHSMIVTYVDPSRDAAIAGTYKDFKFTNDTEAPIYIEAYTSGGYIYFNVYGEETRASDHEVEYVSETLTTTESETVYKADSSLSFDTISKSESGHTGYTAQLWKIITEAGVEVSREVINSSTYKKTDTIYLVGTKSDDEDAVSALKKAIKSGDLSKIKKVIAKYSSSDDEDEDDDSSSKSNKSSKSDSSDSTDTTETTDTTESETTETETTDTTEQ